MTEPVKDFKDAVELIRYGLLSKIHDDGEELTCTEQLIMDICVEVLYPKPEVKYHD